MALIEYDMRDNITERKRIKSLKESVQRALDEVDRKFAEAEEETKALDKKIESLAKGDGGGGGDTPTGSVSWSDITEKPSTFPPSSHTHMLAQITDHETLSNTEIESLINGMA